MKRLLVSENREAKNGNYENPQERRFRKMSFGNLRRVHHAIPSCPSSSILTINAHSTNLSGIPPIHRNVDIVVVMCCRGELDGEKEEVEFNVGVQSINLHDKKIFLLLLILHSPPLSDFPHRRFLYRILTLY